MESNKTGNLLKYVTLFLAGVLTGSIIFMCIRNAGDSDDEEAEITEEETTEQENENLITQDVYDDLIQLKSFVDYALEKYCGEKGVENTYSYELFENMIHHNTMIEGETPYVYDLNRRISKRLVNDKYYFMMDGKENQIIVLIDTYRMKIYVYENVKGQIHVIDGGDLETRYRRSENLDDCVKCDWPDDMWDTEYHSFVINGWEYLTTPSFEEGMRINPDLYGMVTYSLQRYCKEHGIDGEMFYFEFPRDLVSEVVTRVFTVKVESDNRMLYMDIDMDRNKVHVYQVE